jgi:predicted nucleic acid-binding protein
MTLVLDSGGVSALTGNRALLHSLRRRDAWPPQVPAVVLAESLTGDPRRDFTTNQLLRMCQIHDVDEGLAREAAALRAATGRAGTVSATDAIVVALAAALGDAIVLTSDVDDLGALAAHSPRPVRVSRA